MTNTNDSRPLASAPELSSYLGIPETTLSQWRWKKTGPKWLKVGRHVRYRWADIEKWLDEN